MKRKTWFFPILVMALMLTFLNSLPGLARTDSKEAAKAPGKVAILALPSNSPLITFRVMVHAGSANDPAGKEGVATLTATLINEGGNQTLTYKDLLKKLYPMAASIDVRADKEVVTFVGETHKDHLDGFYRIFADNLLKPRFDQSEFERLRDDAVNTLEKTLRGTNDEELGKQALEVELFSGQPYGHAVRGTVQSLKRLKLDDVKDFYKHHYTQANITLGVAGDVDAKFLKQMESDFGALPAGASADLKLAAPSAPEGIELTLIEKETRASAISLGLPINVTRKDADFYALLVANSFFGEHRTFNGVLMQNMRVKRGLNYGDYSYIEHFVQEGGSTFAAPNTPRRQQYFSIWVRPVPNEARMFALRQAVWELERFTKNGMTEKEFESSRQFLLNYSQLWTQTLSRRLGYRLDSRFYGFEDFGAEIQKRLPKLTLAEVNAAIRKHLNPRTMKVVMVTKDGEALKTQLLANAPSPMKYEGSTPQEILNEDKEIEKYALPLNQKKLKIVPVTQVFEN